VAGELVQDQGPGEADVSAGLAQPALAGNGCFTPNTHRLANRSTHCGVYQPPRPYPIWASHGHTRSGAARTVTPRVHSTIGRAMNSSPGSGPDASSSLTPVRALTRRAAPDSTQPATAAADTAGGQGTGCLRGAGKRDFLLVLSNATYLRCTRAISAGAPAWEKRSTDHPDVSGSIKTRWVFSWDRCHHRYFIPAVIRLSVPGR